MSDGEARAKLLGSELSHLYTDYKDGYSTQPGILVTDAENPSLNGWYERRPNSAGPPKNSMAMDFAVWQKWTGKREWFQKDDGCYVLWYPCGSSSNWHLWNADGQISYSGSPDFSKWHVGYMCASAKISSLRALEV